MRKCLNVFLSTPVIFLCFLFATPAFSQKSGLAKLISSKLILMDTVISACHASSIEKLPDNSFIATWFGGKYEGHKEVAIYTSIFRNGVWAKPIVVANGSINDTTQYSTWNPVLFLSSAKRLMLFYKVGPNPREWWGMMKSSEDLGRTWSSAIRLPDGFLGPVRNKPIQLANGDILHPSSTESKDEKVWHVHLEKSDSTGHDWEMIPVDCDTFGVIQPAILRHGKSRLQMLCRSRQNSIVQSWSDDNGMTWGALSKLPMKNPNSGIDAVTTRKGIHILVYNPAVAGKEWMNGRNELRVAQSTNGIEWNDVFTLEKHDNGEFSYPAIIEASNEDLHITYTYDRKNIKHVILKL